MDAFRRLSIIIPFALAVTLASACPYSIRDAGFIVTDPVPYRFGVVVCNASEAALAAQREQLRKAAALALDHADVEAVMVDGRNKDDTLVQKAEALGAEGHEAQYVLLSPRGEAMALKAPVRLSGEKAYTALLREVVESPLRDRIMSQIVTEWAVILVVDGADTAENRKVVDAATAAARQMVGFKPEMGHTIKSVPPVLRTKWDDDREQVLRWSLGLDDGSHRQARVAVLFGRGRRVGPVLTATQATTPRLLETLRLMGKNCTCTADPTSLIGPALPLNWGQDRQQQVREVLGFDPNSPAVATTLSGVWKTLRPADGALVPGDTVPDPTTGYVEFSVDPGTAAPAKDPDAANENDEDDEGASIENRSWRAAGLVGAAVTVAVVGGAAVMAWRSHKRS
ncbi:MAG: hypothetical protein ABFD96_16730 [Armatimonadia bacterium]